MVAQGRNGTGIFLVVLFLRLGANRPPSKQKPYLFLPEPALSASTIRRAS